MNRFKALVRKTWWLWLAFIVATAIAISYSLVFLVMIPVLLGVFIYFAIVRYDDDGNFIGP